MSLLHPSARSSIFSVPSVSTRCLNQISRRVSTQSTSSYPRSRSVLVSNLPPTFTVPKVLGLKGFGRPKEVVVKESSNSVLIHYFDSKSAKILQDVASCSQDGLMLDGQQLNVEPVEEHHPLPAEVVAAVGFKDASRKLHIKDLPEHFTEKELEEEMRRFGEVEQIWIDKSHHRATVTFSDIMSAIKANKTLRVEKGWENAIVLFVTDNHKVQPISANEEAAEQSNYTVYLDGLPRDITPSRLLKDLKGLLIFKHGEPLLGINMVRNTAFLTFADPALARFFYNSYNPTRSIGKSWAKSEKPPLSRILAAVQLGATRTLFISKFNDPRINFNRVHEDFSKFGRLCNVYVDWPNRRAWVEFTDVMSALKALNHIHENNRNFSIYAGSQITFAKKSEPGQRPHQRLRSLIVGSVDQVVEGA